ncbi:hypothetical protein V1291_004625 [Nitrobacteraceae bacterium AZCC 1564]
MIPVWLWFRSSPEDSQEKPGELLNHHTSSASRSTVGVARTRRLATRRNAANPPRNTTTLLTMPKADVN